MAAPFVHRLRVRYGECDPQGVVFNANYVMYFDVALTELWREAIGPYGDMIEAGTDLVVAETTARYLAPASFDDELDVEVLVARLGLTGMTMALRVRRGSVVVVEGEMRHVFIDPATKEKKPIPDDIRRGLEPYLAEAPSSGERGEGATIAQRSSRETYSRSAGPA